MLVLKKSRLDKMSAGIFARGMVLDATEEFNFTGKRQMLKWVAVRGIRNDWAIYVGREDQSFQDIADYGDKICTSEYIKYLVPCDEEAFNLYRK